MSAVSNPGDDWDEQPDEYDPHAFDFDAVEITQLLVPDVYDAEVERVVVRDGEKGPYLRFTFSVLTESGSCVRVDDILSFSQGARTQTYANLCVIAGERLHGVFQLDRDAENFIGKRCRLRLARGEWGGREINDVKAILPYDMPGRVW